MFCKSLLIACSLWFIAEQEQVSTLFKSITIVVLLDGIVIHNTYSRRQKEKGRRDAYRQLKVSGFGESQELPWRRL
jgi:hypothetical protein